MGAKVPKIQGSSRGRWKNVKFASEMASLACGAKSSVAFVQRSGQKERGVKPPRSLCIAFFASVTPTGFISAARCPTRPVVRPDHVHLLLFLQFFKFVHERDLVHEFCIVGARFATGVSDSALQHECVDEGVADIFHDVLSVLWLITESDREPRQRRTCCRFRRRRLFACSLWQVR